MYTISLRREEESQYTAHSTLWQQRLESESSSFGDMVGIDLGGALWSRSAAAC